MRIGLFTDSYPPFINGVSTSTAMLKKALEKEGHQVYVVTVSDSAVKFKYEENKRIVKIPGLPIGIYDYRLSRIYPLSLIKLIKSWDLDVIHSQTEFGIGIFARIFAKQFNIPLVHTYHTLYEDYTHYITHGYFDKSSKKIVEYLTKFYCDTTATELIVPTNKTYRIFKEKYNFKKNIHIIPTGIETERFYTENVDKKNVESLKKKIGITKRDFVVLFVGRLAEEKNVEFLLNAQIKLINKIPNLKLLIVGDGPNKEKYENKTVELGINNTVIFTGKVAWEDVPLYYHCSDLFTSASTSETQGLTVIEAMASNIPPICIKDEAFESAITNELNGLIFNNETDYINEIVMLHNDRKKLQQISSQARIKAEHCSSKQYALNVLDVYKRAIITKKEQENIITKMYSKIMGGK